MIDNRIEAHACAELKYASSVNKCDVCSEHSLFEQQLFECEHHGERVQMRVMMLVRQKALAPDTHMQCIFPFHTLFSAIRERNSRQSRTLMSSIHCFGGVNAQQNLKSRASCVGCPSADLRAQMPQPYTF